MAIEITIPRLGWSMEEGVFAGWLKHDGEPVRAGDPLFSLEGEKATQDVEAIDDGTLSIPSNAPCRRRESGRWSRHRLSASRWGI